MIEQISLILAGNMSICVSMLICLPKLTNKTAGLLFVNTYMYMFTITVEKLHNNLDNKTINDLIKNVFDKKGVKKSQADLKK